MGSRKTQPDQKTANFAVKNFYLTAAIAASTITFAGCGPQSAVPNSRSSAQQNSPAGAPNSENSGSVADGSSPVTPGTEVLRNTNANDILPANGTMANRRRMADLPGKSEKPPAAPAPDNSSVTTTMATDGSFKETRVFTGDGQIEKVVKVSKGRDQTATVFLKSGRQLKVPADRIPALKTISLAELKQVAGIVAKPPIDERERRNKGSVRSPR